MQIIHKIWCPALTQYNAESELLTTIAYRRLMAYISDLKKNHTWYKYNCLLFYCYD